MKFKPNQDRVLIEPDPVEKKSSGGIIIPDIAQEKPKKGTVIAVGGGTKSEKMIFKAGDVVYYDKNAGREINLDKTYLILRSSEILGNI